MRFSRPFLKIHTNTVPRPDLDRFLLLNLSIRMLRLLARLAMLSQTLEAQEVILKLLARPPASPENEAAHSSAQSCLSGVTTHTLQLGTTIC
jgi:hypothetical protein